jgi:hypothetical protein
MKRLVEIRSYKLKAGATSAFHNALVTAAVPLLATLQKVRSASAGNCTHACFLSSYTEKRGGGNCGSAKAPTGTAKTSGALFN